MSGQYAVGIDLGTSTSGIAVFRSGKPEVIKINEESFSPLIPSIVALNDQNQVVIGPEAVSYADQGSGIREIKRSMESGEMAVLGDKTYRPEQISALILKKLKTEAEFVYDIPITEVVLSVPAIFNDIGKHNTIMAAELAGLKVKRLISEPTAAVMAFGIEQLDVDEKILVFDFGGGTLDISTVEMMDEVIDVSGTYGDSQLGGKDFDQVIMDLIIEKVKADQGVDINLNPAVLHQLKSYAEKCKIELSSKERVTLDLPFMGSIYAAESSLVEITRAEFEAAAVDLLARARTCLMNALEVTNSSPEDIDRVLLVGGSSYIPAVRKMLAETFTCPLSMDVPPDLAVSMGTAIFAASLMGQTDLMLIDGYAWGIGTDVVVPRGDNYLVVYNSLAKPNTTIPYLVTKSYTLLTPDQDTLEVNVYQTLNPRATSLAEVIHTGKSAQITGIPPSNTGSPHAVEIDFAIDTNQTIKLKARIPATGQELNISFSSSELRLEDPEDIAKAKVEVDELWNTNPQSRVLGGDRALAAAALEEPDPDLDLVESALERRARSLAEMVEGQEREKILALLNRIAAARRSGDAASVEAAEDDLVELLMDL